MAISKKTFSGGSSLRERLRARIVRDGPISFHDWMQIALYDQREGYYCRSDRLRWGRAGDYRTAPEVSPLFAATFARYFAKLFAEMGSPQPWTIMEVGAGSGEFAQIVLESLALRHPSVYAATRYVIDEINSASSERIRERLSQFRERVDFCRLDHIARPIKGVIFSNELLDAFPVHRVVLRDGHWRELRVGVNDQGKFIWSEAELPNDRVANYLDTSEVLFSEGQVVEINLDAEDWIARAAAALERGFMISVDYGDERGDLLRARERHEGTLRAFHRHGFVEDVLANPGEQDLTTTVNWTQIKQAGERAGLRTVKFERLDQFLTHEGLLDELEQLANEQKSGVDILRLRTSAREMIMPHGLASSFQVLVQQKA